MLNMDILYSGFAKIYDYGVHKFYYFMAMDLLGPSLAELFHFCDGRFSLKTTLKIGYQMIERLQHLHSKGLVHRDIKPDNILMGANDQSHLVHLVDFGLVKKVVDIKTGKHIPPKAGKDLI